MKDNSNIELTVNSFPANLLSLNEVPLGYPLFKIGPKLVKPVGKYYFEVKVLLGLTVSIGWFRNPSNSSGTPNSPYFGTAFQSVSKEKNPTLVNADDVIGTGIDFGQKKIYFYINGKCQDKKTIHSFMARDSEYTPAFRILTKSDECGQGALITMDRNSTPEGYSSIYQNPQDQSIIFQYLGEYNNQASTEIRKETPKERAIKKEENQKNQNKKSNKDSNSPKIFFKTVIPEGQSQFFDC